jgi:hypothetical protein
LKKVIKAIRKSGHSQTALGLGNWWHAYSYDKHSYGDYLNRKGSSLLIQQSVCDYSDIFRDMNIGWPRTIPDSCVFANSEIYGSLFLEWRKQFGERSSRLPRVLFKDLAFEATHQQIYPYTNSIHFQLLFKGLLNGHLGSPQSKFQISNYHLAYRNLGFFSINTYICALNQGAHSSFSKIIFWKQIRIDTRLQSLQNINT